MEKVNDGYDMFDLSYLDNEDFIEESGIFVGLIKGFKFNYFGDEKGGMN